MERGAPLGMFCRRKVISTDASNLGWGALCDGKLAFGLWSKKESYLHINCLEILAVCLGLHKLPGRSFLEVPLILADHLLRWAQLNLRLQRATHMPGKLNLGADMLSRSNVPSDKWTLHPRTVQEIWAIFGRPEVDIFTSEDNTHCQTYFSKDRYALAHDWPNLLLYVFP